MLKRISWIGLASLFSIGAVTFYCPDFVQAGGTYKLEYPQGYGCCCIPNPAEFGYYRTGWREWPCEIRRDKTFPRSIGMEAIPVPEGQKIIPPPKVPVNQVPQGEAQPTQIPEGGAAQPQEGAAQPQEGAAQPQEGGLTLPEIPGAKPSEPGKETPALPELPQEPGGFNPLPGLPPDLNAPNPMNPKENEDNNPTTEPKQESVPKEESPDKDKTEAPAADSKSEDKGAGNQLPSILHKTSRLDSDKHSTNIVRGVTYHEPAESPLTAHLSRDIAPQSYRAEDESNEASVVVQSGLQVDAPSSELQHNAPTVALDGFCPVELNLHGRWVQGDLRWTVVYKGFIYRLSGNAQRQEFLSNPDKYIPANGGFDPVISVVEKRDVPGQVNFCAAYKDRLYMFSSANAQKYFQNNPELYTGGAMK